MPKKVVIVLYEYFYPGYKAGGPIQSLVNMIDALHNHYEFKVITTAFDLNDTTPYSSITTNCWSDVRFPEKDYSIKVWYAGKSKISIWGMKKILNDASANFIFVNGLFTSFFFHPLFWYKLKMLKNAEVILSPRGMLQTGALRVKKGQKKVYLNLLKAFGFFNKVKWHATNTNELEDINDLLGRKANAIIAANVPKKPLPEIRNAPKVSGVLRLVYLSIITPKKNLLLLLTELNKQKVEIYLDIYGPVKEPFYWEKCLEVIKRLPSNIAVQYLGDVPPHLVQSTIEKYDALISLTAGENFGHALYESLSCGRPVITSNFTPWNKLEQNLAGWNVDINNNENIQLSLQKIAMMNAIEFNSFCNGSWQLALNYYQHSDFHKNYCTLFSS